MCADGNDPGEEEKVSNAGESGMGLALAPSKDSSQSVSGGAQSAGAHTQVAGAQVPAATASVFSGNGEAGPAAEEVGGGV